MIPTLKIACNDKELSLEQDVDGIYICIDERNPDNQTEDSFRLVEISKRDAAFIINYLKAAIKEDE